MIVLFLVLTLIFGGIFLGVKAYEWNEKFEQHHVPGPSFHLDGVPQQGHAQLFFSLYFAMTGLHATHMVIGVGLISWLIWLARLKRAHPRFHEIRSSETLLDTSSGW